MGCGSLLLSDAGHYPAGMTAGKTMQTYNSADEAVKQIEQLLGTPDTRLQVTRAGTDIIRKHYSKEIQWRNFENLV
jgi:spore maturation protein CgeB